MMVLELLGREEGIGIGGNGGGNGGGSKEQKKQSTLGAFFSSSARPGPDDGGGRKREEGGKGEGGHWPVDIPCRLRRRRQQFQFQPAMTDECCDQAWVGEGRMITAEFP